jgi:ribose-phosphate pyrophosphokinase
MMRIWTHAGEVPYRQFTFPDGQRHLELQLREENPATIEARIANADELFDVLLAKDALSARGCSVALDIRYLLGARMDRQLSPNEPFTLAVVARQILSAGFRKIRVLDPHSNASLRLLEADGVYPQAQLTRVLSTGLHGFAVAPDKGATERVAHLVQGRLRILQGRKHRELRTGVLTGFSIEDVSWGKGGSALIVDDLCDGGGTFVGLAKVLHDAGVPTVDLFVTHGIFSKGTPLEGIRTIYTTNSYSNQQGAASVPLPSVVVLPIVMGGP